MTARTLENQSVPPKSSKRGNLTNSVMPKLALLSATVIVALVGCEFACRWAGEDLMPPPPLTSYLARPWGSVLAPETAPGMVNSFGTFDVEHQQAKPAGTLRLATLGDSFLGLPTLPHAAQAPQLLQNTLNRSKSANTYEVLNFSVSSAGTATEYLRYLHDARRFAPDLVLVYFTISNDMRNNSVVLQPMMEACPIPLPGFVLTDAGELKEVTMPAAPGSCVYYESDASRSLVQNSALCRKASRAWQVLNGARSLGSAAKQREITASFLQSPAPPEVTDAWNVTEALFSALDKAVRKDSAHLAVVLIPTSWDIEPKWKQWLYDHLPQSCSHESLNFDLPYAEALKRLKRQNIPLLDLRPSFRAAFQADPALPLYDESGHWSRRGHVIAAEASATFVGDLLAKEPVCAP
jgi:hypothetical protein